MIADILLQRPAATPQIARVTLFNPDKLNAINGAMWRRLREVMAELSADDTVRAVIIGGEGPNFAAGGDLDEFLHERDTRERAARYHGEWVAPALRAITECKHPVIAAIQGACVGGGLEIAGQCDLRIAGDSARFGAPIMKLGFPMYPGELAGVLALAGPATALEILLEGRLLSAAEALQKQLVNRVVTDDQVVAEAERTAQRIASGAPLVAQAHKRLVRRLMAAAANLTDAEMAASFDFLQTADYAEGMAAFMEKRTPNFKGR